MLGALRSRDARLVIRAPELAPRNARYLWNVNAWMTRIGLVRHADTRLV